MVAAWTDPHELTPAENFQDPAQHWLLVPSDPEADRDFEDLVVAYVFSFANKDDYHRFTERFTPDSDNRIRVFFAGALNPLVVKESGPLITVGFSELGNLSAIYNFIAEIQSEMYLTGLPIENIENSLPGSEFGDLELGDNVIGIIDTDIAFANARFRESVTKTRIKAFWDQDARAGPNLPLFLGQALHGDRIDQYLSQFDQNGNVDEPALYADYFQTAYDPNDYPRLPTSKGHGTHILDLITGGEGPGDPIIAVDLRSRAVDATHGLLLLPWVVLGFMWILQLTHKKAQQFEQPQVNFSFGGLAGRHDGMGPLEFLFDLLLGAGWTSAITIPAGNFFDSDTHASFTGAEISGGQKLEWQVQPDDGTSNILELWLPTCQDDPQLELSIQPPVGPSLTITDAEVGTYRELHDGPTLLARVYIQCVSVFGAFPRVRIAIFLRHTAIDRDYFQFEGGRADLAGSWELTLQQRSLPDDERVELWIERDDALGLAGNGARQSYFDAPHPVPPETAPLPHFVRNEDTTSDIATGAMTLVAAGSVRNSRQPALYSSEGSVGPPDFLPTAAAISDDSRIHKGVLASGFFSDSTFGMNGTSVSSAVMAHIVAGRRAAGQAGQGVTRAEIVHLATTQDGRMIPPTAPMNPVFQTYPVPPATRIGGGCLASGWTRLPRIVP